MTTAESTVTQTGAGDGLDPAEHPAVERQRPAGALAKAWRDTVGLITLTLRLVWRHWPVLLSLALAGTLAREGLLTAAIKASDRGPLPGLLVFMLTPIALLVAMVLMLRTLRPSLPRIGLTEREPVLRHVGTVLVPFLIFYLYAGFLDYDYQRYNYGFVQMTFENPFEPIDISSRFASSIPTLWVAALATSAFVVRWLLNRFEVIRRRPALGLPAVYLEIVGLFTALLLGKMYVDRFLAWRNDRVVWQAGMEMWHSDFAALGAAAGPLREVRDYLGVVWSTAQVVLIVPVSALLSAAVVLAANTAALNARQPSRSKIMRMVRIGGQAGRPVGRVSTLTRFFATMRLVLRSGVVMMMAFCLLFVAAFTVDERLFAPERWLIGPQNAQGLWDVLFFPLEFINQAIGLVLIISLMAAAVERSPLGDIRPRPAPSDGQHHVPGQL